MTKNSNIRTQKFWATSFIILLIAAVFVPFFPVNIVPEWELTFESEDGISIPSVRFDQMWKDYSLEFWSSGENADRNLESDPNGYIKLPARNIRVSLFQIGGSYLRDAIMNINPHASFGPKSYIVCRGERNCLVSYKQGEHLQRAVVR
jgi:hypothetical protein